MFMEIVFLPRIALSSSSGQALKVKRKDENMYKPSSENPCKSAAKKN
jgi:hypothetical protein